MTRLYNFSGFKRLSELISKAQYERDGSFKLAKDVMCCDIMLCDVLDELNEG